MSMSNSAFHRLMNEWTYNKFNDTMLAICEREGVDPSDMYIDTDIMKAIRSECKKVGVWLQDFDEEDLYIDLMPFGGYKNYAVLKEALREYRKTERKYNGLVKAIVEKYERRCAS